MNTAYETSFPCMAAAKEFNIPLTLVFNFGWGIILNCRGQEQCGWTRASTEIVHRMLGANEMIRLHDRLLATFVAQNVVPFQEPIR